MKMLETWKFLFMVVLFVVGFLFAKKIIDGLKAAGNEVKDIFQNPFQPLANKIRDVARGPAKVTYREGEAGQIQKDLVAGKIDFAEARKRMDALKARQGKVTVAVKP